MVSGIGSVRTRETVGDQDFFLSLLRRLVFSLPGICIILDKEPKIRLEMCHLPVTSVVEKTYFRQAALFPKRELTYAGQITIGDIFYDNVMQESRRSTARLNMMYGVWHSCRNLDF
ncbi:hypothetical protein J1N35_018947 [Gossypium stocksii]|uniref:Uncharacterized protein n=1 Tax=Gossypium stocksii TaxID=47602 RepID=A0A9D4A7N5_9ROSI|nr:hypothetical protein J1N35_018947 [Gossypium stocksii]